MNDHEMDPLARLRAIDPAAGATYEHPDVAAMLTRVTARPRLERVSFARGFRVRMAGAVAAAALVSFGGIAVLESSAPSLSVFALGATSPSPHVGSATDSPNFDAKSPSTTGPVIPAGVTFVAGAGLSSQSESAPSYSLIPAGNFGTLSERIAHTFGVHGAPSSAPAADATWSIGPTSRDFLSFWSDSAELHWEYTDSAASGTISTDAPTPLATVGHSLRDSAALVRSQLLIHELGIAGPFGLPSYSQTVSGRGVPWTTVTIPWYVGGPGSGFSFDVSLESSGTIVAADGVDVAVTRGAIYPLISPVAGVAALNSEAQRTTGSVPTSTAPTLPPDVNPGGPMIPASPTTTIDPGGPMIPASPTTTIDPGGPMIPATTTDSTTAPPATSSRGSATSSSGSANDATSVTQQSITLRSASLQYTEYGLANGTEVLLPEWVYTGNDGSQWAVLAVSPAYIKVVSVPSVGNPISGR